MAKPIDTELYNKIKRLANDVFKSPTGIYRSMWISKKYIDAGGEYDTPKNNTKSKTKKWLAEKWIDLNNPIMKGNKIIGYNRCGSKNIDNPLIYPLCRPSVKIDSSTPRIYQTINKKDIEKANIKKQILRNKGNTTF